MKQGQQYTCDECGLTVESVEQDRSPSGWTFRFEERSALTDPKVTTFNLEWIDLCHECRKKHDL